MWTKIQYTLLFCWVKSIALFPLKILYILADFLYLLIYKIIRYRVKVVRRNLRASFPDKSDIEIERLEQRFYHHFADYIVETLKLAHISQEEITTRARLNNPEVFNQLMAKGHTCCIMLMGHYGNWEWFTSSSVFLENTRIYQIYRPLKNKAVDKLFVYLRTRFHSYGIPKHDTMRDIIRLKRDKIRSTVIFIADQTPSRANLHYWTNFMNQDSAIITGPERIARKMNLPVIFLDTKQVRRGYYTIDLKLITEAPNDMPENRITEEYVRLMEKCIRRDPANYLWTHKRWKYKRENV